MCATIVFMMSTMRRTAIIICATTTLGLLSACNNLSSEAKKMVGNYYIPEISEDEPLMELRKDGHCTIRAIKPGVLTFSVDGEWNVSDDSLRLELDPTTLTVDGDKSLVGEIPVKSSRAITGYNGISLTINDSGVTYVYHRRNE